MYRHYRRHNSVWIWDRFNHREPACVKTIIRGLCDAMRLSPHSQYLICGAFQSLISLNCSVDQREKARDVTVSYHALSISFTFCKKCHSNIRIFANVCLWERGDEGECVCVRACVCVCVQNLWCFTPYEVGLLQVTKVERSWN